MDDLRAVDTTEEEYFQSVPLNNSSMLCVGGITRKEAEYAHGDGVEIDGYGYYLFIASAADPKKPIEVLAKFASSQKAETLARLFASARLSG